MAQSSYNLPNSSGATFRSNLNNALAAVKSVNSGNSAPSDSSKYMYWVDEQVSSGDKPILKQRNQQDDGNIELAEINGQSYFSSGTAAKPGIAFRDDKDCGLQRSGDDKISLVTNGVNRVTVDASGNVGIGEASPEANLHVENTPNCTVQITSGSTGNSTIRLGYGDSINDGKIQYVNGDGNNGTRSLSFSTANSTRLTILSDGKCGIGETTPTELLHVAGNIKTTGNIFIGDTGAPQSVTDTTEKLRLQQNEASVAANAAAGLKVNRLGSNGDAVKFFRSGVEVGSISVTGSATAYNESSDHRLKENIVDIADGITRVKQLQPRRFNFIVDAETTVDGFIAHEAQAVVPEAVTGTHNEVDENGDPVMQGIDKSKFVPLLTAALQEAIAKIETLEAKVAALEAGN